MMWRLRCDDAMRLSDWIEFEAMAGGGDVFVEPSRGAVLEAAERAAMVPMGEHARAEAVREIMGKAA